MTKKLLILLAFAIPFLTIGAGCAKQVAVNPTDNTVSSTTVVATSTNPYAVGTLTYRNDTYGFEFPYPADTVVTANPPLGGRTLFYIGGPDEKGGSGVWVKANTQDQTLQQAFDENYNRLKEFALRGAEFEPKDLYISDIKVDGHDAKELYVDHFGDSGSTMVSVVNNGYVYMIAGGNKRGDLDKFLSTFKFTSPATVTNINRIAVPELGFSYELSDLDMKNFPIGHVRGNQLIFGYNTDMANTGFIERLPRAAGQQFQDAVQQFLLQHGYDTKLCALTNSDSLTFGKSLIASNMSALVVKSSSTEQFTEKNCGGLYAVRRGYFLTDTTKIDAPILYINFGVDGAGIMYSNGPFQFLP